MFKLRYEFAGSFVDPGFSRQRCSLSEPSQLLVTGEVAVRDRLLLAGSSSPRTTAPRILSGAKRGRALRQLWSDAADRLGSSPPGARETASAKSTFKGRYAWRTRRVVRHVSTHRRHSQKTNS